MDTKRKINTIKQVTKTSTFCAFLQTLGSLGHVSLLGIDFCVNLAALHSKFVDLRFSDVSPFLGLFQLVLELAEFR